MTEELKVEELRRFEAVDEWPMKPFLPVKHRTERVESGMPKLGVMFHCTDDGKDEFWVFDGGNIYAVEGLYDCPMKMYHGSDRAGKIYDDGWITD